MATATLHINGDACWPELLEKIERGEVVRAAPAALQFARLPGGMTSGASSVTIRVDLPDGRVVLVETSLRMLGLVARAFEAADEGDAERAAAAAKGATS